MAKITRPVWAEINLDNLIYNYRKIKVLLKEETKIMAVVKADAYGHGMIPVATTLRDQGVDRLGVALPEEGVELRKAGIELPIHILGEVLKDQYKIVVENELIPTVARLDSAEKLNEIARQKKKTVTVHIKIDTGMGRIGVQSEETLDFIKKINSLDNIYLEGLMTHFSTADESNKEYTHQQWGNFKKAIKILKKNGINIPLKHAGNSAAVIDLPEYQLDMVRPGISLYGSSPSAKVRKIGLKPVLSWKAKIDFLKVVPPGKAISYGATYITKKTSKIATIPLGYADGYSRLLSNKGHVLVKGQKAPIVGVICMDQFMIDVTHIDDVKIGDEIVLLGKQGSNEITAVELADLVGTINYEIFCNISRRVPREYKIT
ncbi:MAG: alanine racemase [Halanaerobiaceae bacterium]